MGTNYSACCSIDEIDKNYELCGDDQLNPKEIRKKESTDNKPIA